MMAELYGRANGVSKGKAGSMHGRRMSVLWVSAVVSSTISLAELPANQLRSQSSISCVFGDGATEQGTYHESFNFAALYQLPTLFLCENNGLAVHATLAERHSYKIHEHARSYGLETVHR